MKKLSMFLYAVSFVLGIVGNSRADLWDRGGGLIYDDVQDITWLENANYPGGWKTWSQALIWVDQLEYYDSVRDVTWTDWRLPTALNPDSTGPCLGYDCTGSELGSLYYVALDNPGQVPISNTGPFDNVQAGSYHTSTEDVDTLHFAWYFNFYVGYQGSASIDSTRYVWPVLDGDVAAIPIPGGVWLLGSGLVGLVGFRKKFKK